MTWKKVNNSDAGDSTHFGGNDFDKVADAFSGVDVDDINMNCDFTFRSGKMYQRNPGNTFSYNFVPGAITADRTLNWPVITGTDTVATTGLAQTFSNKTVDARTNNLGLYLQWKYVIFQDGSNTKCLDLEAGTTVSSSTDDDVPIQYAVDNAAGKPILIKGNNTYVCNSTIDCNDKYVYMVGDSAGTKAPKIQKAGSGNILQFDNTISDVLDNSVHLENLVIDGVDKLGTGIRTEGCKGCFNMMKNVAVTNCDIGWSFSHGWYNNMYGMWVGRCNIGLKVHNNGVPATFQDGGNTLYFWGGKFQGCSTYNAYFDVTDDASFYSTIFEDDLANTYSIKIDSEVEHLRFYNCSLENYPNNAIIIHDEGKNVRIQDCRFQVNDAGTTITCYEGVGARNTVLMGNVFGGSSTSTINVTLDSNCSQCVLAYNQARRWITSTPGIVLTDNSTSSRYYGNSFVGDRHDNYVDLDSISSPANPGTSIGRLYVKATDGSNNDLYVRIKQGGSMVEKKVTIT